jgi:hypothetical protein
VIVLFCSVVAGLLAVPWLAYWALLGSRGRAQFDRHSKNVRALIGVSMTSSRSPLTDSISIGFRAKDFGYVHNDYVLATPFSITCLTRE